MIRSHQLPSDGHGYEVVHDGKCITVFSASNYGGSCYNAGAVLLWPHVADFRRIRQELLRRGLFETDMGYYAKMFAWQRPPGSEAQPAEPQQRVPRGQKASR